MLHLSTSVEQIQASKTVFFQLPLWQLAFRSSFLLGTFSSVVTLVLWVGMLNGWWQLSMTGLSPVVWHLHEMLFGFAAMIAIGFVLTAVQTWTGVPSIQGKPLALLVLLWIVARIGFWLNTSDWLAAAIIAQMIWWLISVSVFARLLLATKNQRNYVLIGLFCVMAGLNLSLVITDVSGHADLALHLGRTMVLMFTLLMSIIGGRVIPFFTQRGARLTAIQHPPKLDLALMIVSIAGVIVFLSSHFISLPTGLFQQIVTPAPLMITAGILHLIRLGYWQGHKTIKIPLLWSLHLAYLLMALGLIALGASYLIHAISFSSALHLITIGATGLMILSMISRVSLGHTGRPLSPSPVLSIAFALMVIAALTRAVLPAFGLTLYAWNISALLWIVAALIFLFYYTPILLSPRKNG